MRFRLLLLTILFAALICMLAPSCERSASATEKVLVWYKKESDNFLVSTMHLKKALGNLEMNNRNTVTEAKELLRGCRLQYKRIAFFLEYFFPEEAGICNGPPVQEIESLEEFREPSGLQVIESLLYAEAPYLAKEEMIKQADLLSRTVANLSPLLYDFRFSNNDLLNSLGAELVRIITLYITGFDSPRLKTGIEEAQESLSTINVILSAYTIKYAQKDSLDYYLAAGKGYLHTHTDFDSFDRLFFITRYALPIEQHLNKLINETGSEQNGNTAYNSNAKDLFANNAIDKKSFPHSEDENDTILTRLGEQLFFEKKLSSINTRSCATCHSPGAFFSDQLPRNRSLDGTEDLSRNTPSLLYVCYQYAQFWDGRVESLEDQVRDVLGSKKEMNISGDTVIKRLLNDPSYTSTFKKIWPKNSAITMAHTVGALAAFIRTLTPFRSSFDRYMRGEYTALSASQQNGFNLFMGKAQCGTCHFAPLFNGLLPPDYKTTEFEILGTTLDDNFGKPKPDSDPGRYDFVPSPLNMGSFKTPSVRNAAKTAPYMHNGKFSSLENVIDFYDRGGGAGLGFSIPQQTLSPIPLKLSKQEKSDIVAFIQALTDE